MLGLCAAVFSDFEQYDRIDTSAGKTVQCGLDQKTYMEREGQRVFAGALRTDDPVELIVDRKSGSCYARTVRIV